MKTTSRQGTNNKLSIDEVKVIKFDLGHKTAKEVAALYGVHIQTIYKIWDGSNWSWIKKGKTNEQAKG